MVRCKISLLLADSFFKKTAAVGISPPFPKRNLLICVKSIIWGTF